MAVIGDSGIGKSTLLNVVAGLEPIDSGAIYFEGAEVSRMSDDAQTLLRREKLGFVFQAFHILPHLTLAQNVALPLVLAHVRGAEALARATALLAALGLPGRGSDYAAQLSGGELQRIAIARALIHRPALILADEPTGNLDPETGERTLRLLEAQVRDSGAAAILVTHSERGAAVADRVLVLTSEGLVPRHGR